MALYDVSLFLKSPSGQASGVRTTVVDTPSVEIFVKGMYQDRGLLIAEGLDFEWLPADSIQRIEFKEQVP